MEGGREEGREGWEVGMGGREGGRREGGRREGAKGWWGGREQGEGEEGREGESKGKEEAMKLGRQRASVEEWRVE